MSETKKQQWKELSDKEKSLRIENARQGLINYHKNVSQDKKEAKAKKTKETWDNMCEEKKKSIKEKQSIIAKNRKKKKCVYCGIEVDPGNFARHHGEKCKKRV